jgi:hypothetical protein
VPWTTALDHALTLARWYGTAAAGGAGGGPSLVRIAQEQATELIVIGVHGRNPADLMLFGSTTHPVVREAPMSRANDPDGAEGRGVAGRRRCDQSLRARPLPT